MTKQLPPQPSLEHLSNQAKEILKAHKKRSASICARLRPLNRFAKLPDAGILDGEISLADAQFVLAMEYGFKSWSQMKRQVESGPRNRPFNKPDDLLRLGNRAIEVLLRDIDFGDLAVFMLKISPELYSRIWKNMAQRPREMVRNGMAEMGSIDAGKIAKAQEKVLGIANALADEIDNGTQTEGETNMNAWETALISELDNKPAGQRTASELAPIFVELAKVARREGLIAMDEFVDKHVSDELMKLGMRMTIDGTDMAEISSILKARKTTMVQAYERRLEMIIAGVEGIGTGLNPAIMEEKCRAFLG